MRGGYDFPGSNSGTDLHVLTGWIPEQLFLQRCAQCLKLTSSDHGSDRMLTQVSYNDSDDIARSALWTRICNAFNYGDVLITLGTGKLTLKEEEGLGLAGEHDYAVVDVKEQEGQQLFLVKNPWFNGTIWKGHIYRRGTTIDAVKSLNDLHINPEREPLAQGMFWIGLNDVFQSFDSIYLNWNPGLFSFREDVHFKWDLAQSTNSEGSFVSNPQYEIRSSTGGIVWVLLSRHFASAVGTSANSVGTSPSNTSPTQSFISLYAFDNDGEKVFLSDGASSRGPYVDSPNTLLKLELSANRAQTIVISEQALSRTNHTFTLSAYSLTGLTISKAREKLNYCDVQHGAWKSSTAGGNTSSPSYHINPQYSLILADTSDLAILLENPVQGIQVHVQLVWAGGKPIRAITNRDVAGHSGDYKNGYAFAEIHGLPDGAYTIVCSTFEQGQLGSFTLRVCSTSAFTIDRISVEAAGRFVTKVRAAEFTPGADRLIALLISRRLNRVAVKARPIEGTRRSERSPHSPLKLGIEYGQGPSKQILTTSSEDEYSGRSAGIWTGDVDIQPHMCQGRGVWLVLERLGSTELQHNEYVEVELLSDVPIELSEWHVREGI